MQAPSIRPLELADAKAWQSIRRRMLSEHPEAFGADSEEFNAMSLAEVKEFMARNRGPDSVMYGAFHGEELVGTIGFFYSGGVKRRHVRVIWGMYVAPELRGKGLGRQLVERVLEDLRKLEGVLRVSLEVSISNVAASSLYQSCGFEVYGTEPDGLLIGEHLEATLCMNRNL